MMNRSVFDQMEQDDRYYGFGYIGARRNALTSTDPEAPAQPVRVEAADQRILDVAAERGWDYDRLFEWANSRDGRYFADAIFGSDERFDIAFTNATQKWNLL